MTRLVYWLEPSRRAQRTTPGQLRVHTPYEPPSPRDARPVHLGPSPSVHRPTRLTRPLAGAGSQASPPGRRASSERGAGARDLLSCPACRRMHGRSEIFPAVGMAALPPLTPGGQAGGRSMTCLVSRHARHADLSEPPLVDVCRWDHSSTPEGDGPLEGWSTCATWASLREFHRACSFE